MQNWERTEIINWYDMVLAFLSPCWLGSVKIFLYSLSFLSVIFVLFIMWLFIVLLWVISCMRWFVGRRVARVDHVCVCVRQRERDYVSENGIMSWLILFVCIGCRGIWNRQWRVRCQWLWRRWHILDLMVLQSQRKWVLLWGWWWLHPRWFQPLWIKQSSAVLWLCSWFNFGCWILPW